jgi:hypothetical protein
VSSFEKEVEAAGGLDNYMNNRAAQNPEFARRCSEAGLAAWAISCMRDALGRMGFKPMPVVDFVRYLAAGVQGQPNHTAAEIADIAIKYFKLEHEVLMNIANVCRVCRYFGLTPEQTLRLCMATDPGQDSGLLESAIAHCPSL